MGKMNVAQFAGELGLPVELLLEQLQAAGVAKKLEGDSVSEQDKSQLLEHLRSSHGSGNKKITLVRSEKTAIKKADSTGKSRTIQVEVRKKRTLAPAVADAAKEVVPVVVPVAVPAAPVVSVAKVLGDQELQHVVKRRALRQSWPRVKPQKCRRKMTATANVRSLLLRLLNQCQCNLLLQSLSLSLLQK